MSDVKSGRGGRRPGAGRPLLPPEQKQGRKQKLIQTSLPPNILKRLDARAADQGSTRAAVMREIIIAAFTNRLNQ